MDGGLHKCFIIRQVPCDAITSRKITRELRPTNGLGPRHEELEHKTELDKETTCFAS
jgi:hypothetical protein